MDPRRSFVFNKCSCCSKNFNVSQLGINTDSVEIGEELLSMQELLLDVCFLLVRTFWTLVNYNVTKLVSPSSFF